MRLLKQAYNNNNKKQTLQNISKQLAEIVIYLYYSYSLNPHRNHHLFHLNHYSVEKSNQFNIMKEALKYIQIPTKKLNK